MKKLILLSFVSVLLFCCVGCEEAVGETEKHKQTASWQELVSQVSGEVTDRGARSWCAMGEKSSYSKG